jgi:hypothetical protein
MSYCIVEHETEGKVLFNTETQGYKPIPDSRNKIAIKGRLFDYFETVGELLESDRNSSIVLMYCKGSKIAGKRVKVTMATSTETLDFWSVEKVSTGWVRNEIEMCEESHAYMVFLIKEAEFINSVRVRSIKVMEDKK